MDDGDNSKQVVTQYRHRGEVERLPPLWTTSITRRRDRIASSHRSALSMSVCVSIARSPPRRLIVIEEKKSPPSAPLAKTNKSNNETPKKKRN